MPDNHTRQIVSATWSLAHLLHDDGASWSCTAVTKATLGVVGSKR
ncbi:MAG: hypothetical protein OXQ94_15590 [Gemmatimonadota bacterium]|nr:hypothetical protein [Gemmatimonadota bacterium]MDE2873100.1 hypothetical protein [Gemmatimonadota bacterium]